MAMTSSSAVSRKGTTDEMASRTLPDSASTTPSVLTGASIVPIPTSPGATPSIVAIVSVATKKKN